MIPTLGPSNTARVYHARQVTNCGSSSSVCILGFDIPNNVFGEETLQSSELKVYWKPKLSIKRAHGSFRVSVHDVLKLQKPHMTMVVDTKVCFIQKKNYQDFESSPVSLFFPGFIYFMDPHIWCVSEFRVLTKMPSA